MAVHQLPIAGSYVTRLYGLHDDPKLPLDDALATFMNRPWAGWLDAMDAGAGDLWPDLAPAERTLWNARLYPVAGDREESLALSLPLQDPAAASLAWRRAWRASRRLSLAESAAQADVAAISAEIITIEDMVAARRFHSAVLAEHPAAEVRHALDHVADKLERRVRLVDGWLAASDPVTRMRGYTALAIATDQEAWEDKAFSTLAGLIEGQTLPQQPVSRPQVVSGAGAAQLRVEACARVDFGGGWTDTPPYSIERGGTVLNGALTLHGAFPIVVEAERLDEPRLVLDGRDIDAVRACEPPARCSPMPTRPTPLPCSRRHWCCVGSSRRAALLSRRWRLCSSAQAAASS